jgi:hypothetical protein
LQPSSDVTAADDPLEVIAQFRVPTAWSYRGTMTFLGEGVRIDGDADSELAIADGEGRGTIGVAGLARSEIGVHGELTFAIADVALRVHAFVSMGGTSASAAGGARTTYRVRVQEIDARATGANASYGRETILGMRLHPHDKLTWQTRFSTRIFGRRALVAGYATREAATETDAVQIVYEGGPLEDDERHALYDVLRFLLRWFGDTSIPRCQRRQQPSSAGISSRQGCGWDIRGHQAIGNGRKRGSPRRGAHVANLYGWRQSWDLRRRALAAAHRRAP